jgi:hypothetical protein
MPLNPTPRPLTALNQQDAAYLIGKTLSWCRDHARDLQRNPDGSYDAQKVVSWYVTNEVTTALVAAGATGDPKIRKLNADAALQELKYKKLAGEVVPIHLLEPYFMEIASILKRTGEQVQKQYGSEAYDLYAEALEEIQRIGNRTVDEATSQAKAEAENEADGPEP